MRIVPWHRWGITISRPSHRIALRSGNGALNLRTLFNFEPTLIVLVTIVTCHFEFCTCDFTLFARNLSFTLLHSLFLRLFPRSKGPRETNEQANDPTIDHYVYLADAKMIQCHLQTVERPYHTS